MCDIGGTKLRDHGLSWYYGGDALDDDVTHVVEKCYAEVGNLVHSSSEPGLGTMARRVQA